MHNKELRKEIDELKSKEEEIRMLRQDKEAELRRIIQEDSLKKYSKLFMVTHGIRYEPLTILVQAFTRGGYTPWVIVNALDGEYETKEEFDKVQDYAIQGFELGWPTIEKLGRQDKDFNSIHLLLPGALQLVETLNEAIKAMK